jgi:glucarate dehydratase
VLPNLVFSADAHYHHLSDDIIEGGPMRYRDGRIAVPAGPGLGVKLDRDKVAQYAEQFNEYGGYLYDRDPGRPDWFPLVPNTRWADPESDMAPSYST